MRLRDKLIKIWNSKWNPFGNYDDPVPPDWYAVDKPFWYRLIAWYCRNPLHNFCFYWIGTEDRPAEWKVWHSKRRWNLILPFFSYRGERFEFYIGWRPRGNGGQVFGVALRRRKGNE